MFLRKIVEMQSFTVHEDLLKCFVLPEFTFLLQTLHLEQALSGIRGLAMAGLLIFCFFLTLNGKNAYARKWEITGKSAVFTVVLLVWSVLSLTGVSVFLYFNF